MGLARRVRVSPTHGSVQLEHPCNPPRATLQIPGLPMRWAAKAQKLLRAGGDGSTAPPQEFPSPLESLSTSGERGHSPGAGASARETSSLCFCKSLSQDAIGPPTPTPPPPDLRRK